MPRKPKAHPPAAKPPSGTKQVNFRVDGDLNVRLEAAAEGLGLDVSNFLRMMLKEKLFEYERRVELIRRGEPSE